VINLQTDRDFAEGMPSSSIARESLVSAHSAPFSTPDRSLLHPDAYESTSIVVVGPDGQSRRFVEIALTNCHCDSVRTFGSFFTSLADVQEFRQQNHDVIIIDVDDNRDGALQMIESVCANSPATVIAYSESENSELLVRCMRAGAREFLIIPFPDGVLTEALGRASARCPVGHVAKKASGKMYVFMGAKGGVGVTTISSNYAVALAKESGQSTLLIDLDLPLGDAILNFGCVPEYSTLDALQDFSRLDSSLLAKLLVKHDTGLSVLAAPGRLPDLPTSDEAVDKLISVACRNFDIVVIDVGSRLDLFGTALFRDAEGLYLVTQATVTDLRNANRLISHLGSSGKPRLQIVINRYESRSMGVTDEQITKALTRAFDWQIPNDYLSVRKMQGTAVPLALTNTLIARQIRKMAKAVCLLPGIPEKKKGFRLFG
jgi:pilus assembly protein CpaE